jgi:hypothetical protein
MRVLNEQEAELLIARKSSMVREVLAEPQLPERVCLIIVAFALVCGAALACSFDAEPEYLPRTSKRSCPVPLRRTENRDRAVVE